MENVEKRSEIGGFTSSVNAAFGAKLRRRRRSLDLSQEELAARVGLSRVTVATIESGKQNTQLQHVFLFAKALDASPEELVPTTKEVQEYQGSSFTDILKDARALLLQMKRVSHEQQASDPTANRAAGL